MHHWNKFKRAAVVAGTSLLVTAGFSGAAVAGPRDGAAAPTPPNTQAPVARRSPRGQANHAARADAAHQAKRGAVRPRSAAKDVAAPAVRPTATVASPGTAPRPEIAPSAVKPTIAPVDAKMATKPAGVAPAAVTGKDTPSFQKKVDVGHAASANQKFNPKAGTAPMPAPVNVPVKGGQ